ncbi:MAG: hypothetical protein NZT61_04915 [Deltaproteobacteria bacterium]|nr:hypothetical protein [Deltaproteobacteria bacterium]
MAVFYPCQRTFPTNSYRINLAHKIRQLRARLKKKYDEKITELQRKVEEFIKNQCSRIDSSLRCMREGISKLIAQKAKEIALEAITKNFQNISETAKKEIIQSKIDELISELIGNVNVNDIVKVEEYQDNFRIQAQLGEIIITYDFVKELKECVYGHEGD